VYTFLNGFRLYIFVECILVLHCKFKFIEGLGFCFYLSTVVAETESVNHILQLHLIHLMIDCWSGLKLKQQNIDDFHFSSILVQMFCYLSASVKLRYYFTLTL